MGMLITALSRKNAAGFTIDGEKLADVLN
ncbi:hypothetical protein [Bartonella florencae]